MGNVRTCITLLGIAAILSSTSSWDSSWADELPVPPMGTDAPANPTAPADPGTVHAEGLPPRAKPYCKNIAQVLEQRIAALQYMPLKELNRKIPTPTAWTQSYRVTKNKIMKFTREHLKREYPVWILDQGTNIQAALLARQELGTLTAEEANLIDMSLAKTSIDGIISDAKSYKDLWQQMTDERTEAQLRIDILNEELKKVKATTPPENAFDTFHNDRTSHAIALPVVKNGSLDSAPEIKHFDNSSQITVKIKELQDVLKRLDGDFKTEGSFANVARTQVANIKLLRVIREMFDTQYDKARRQGKALTSSMATRYTDIAQVLKRDNSIAEGYNPPPEAWHNLWIKEFHGDFKSLLTTFSNRVNEKRVISGLKKQSQSAIAADITSGRNLPAKRSMSGLFTRSSDSIATPDATGVQPQRVPFDPQRLIDWLNNMAPEERAALGLNRLNGYVTLLRGGLGLTFASGSATLLYKFTNGSVSWSDLIPFVKSLAESSDPVQFQKCVNADPTTYDTCRINYLKTKFIKDYIHDLGLSDSAVSTHKERHEIEIDPDAASTASNHRIFKDLKGGSLFLRSDATLDHLDSQPGLIKDQASHALRLDIKALPASGSGYPIERDSKSGKVVIHGDALVNGAKGFVVYGSDGKEVINPKILAISEDMDRQHLNHLRNLADEANITMKLSDASGLSDPCSNVSVAAWIKAAEPEYQRRLYKCVNQHFHVDLRLDPVEKLFVDAIKADSAHKREAIDKLVNANADFGNFICSYFQQREAALDPKTTIDYKCQPFTDPQAIAAFGGYGIGTNYPGYYPTNGGASQTWPLPSNNQAPWANTSPGNWTTPGAAGNGPQTLPGGVTPAVPGNGYGYPGYNNYPYNPPNNPYNPQQPVGTKPPVTTPPTTTPPATAPHPSTGGLAIPGLGQPANPNNPPPFF